MKPVLLSFNLSRCWHCPTLMFDHTLLKLRTRFENQIFNLVLQWFVCHFFRVMLKMRLALCIGEEMNGRLLMSLCCCGNACLFFFPSKGWDFSFCLFTSHDVGAFACIIFSVGLSDLIHKSRVWLLFCFSCFFNDKYVRASMHVFWYILWNI